ncbi:MAG: tol-pal system-associated acyl-CoA thioesterase [Pseudomonadota bacterium]
MPHRFELRVYYEDTDFAGIVYYANYLKFIERARSEWVREIGIDQVALKRDRDLVFAVRRVEADYLSPAEFDDILLVETAVVELSAARLVLTQNISRQTARLFQSTVTLVCLNGDGRPTRFPAELRHIT